MRLLRLLALLTAGCLLALSVWVGVSNARDRQRDELDARLDGEARAASLALETYFERARALTLMLSQNVVFEQFYAAPGTRLGKVLAGGSQIDGANNALDFVERLYPNRVGEICFIDRTGAENARIVRGRRAAVDDLSADESQNPFFDPTFALAIGKVYQAQPYVSPDTREWVISNSAVIPMAKRSKRAMVHFEITIESFRRELGSGSLVTRVIDGRTGYVVIDSRWPQIVGRPLGRPTDRSLAPIVVGTRTGLLTVADERLAAVPVKKSRDNENDWYVVTSAPAVTGLSLGGIGWRSIALMIGALLAVGGALLGFRVHQRDLRRAALTDDLTGLPNRVLFLDRVRQAMLLNERRSTRCAVAILDLDRFKEVNDTLGHGYGDELLKEVGGRLSSRLRAGDSIARLGGDEFAILLPQVAGADDARVVVERLRAVLDNTLMLEGIGVQIDSSFGVAIFPDHGRDVDTLIQRADIAMYAAKRLRTGIAFYDQGQDPHNERRLGMVAALKHAIEDRQLYLDYQPKIHLANGRVIGVEALARWDHPTLGPISPAEFVSIAEDTGLIRPFTTFVLDEALRQARLWLDAGLDLSTSINISARNLFDPSLLEETVAGLARHGVPAERLELEITESAMMVEPDRARMALEALRGMRISISVDDYGTGHSALAYLKNLPVTELKIDRSFVMSMTKSDTDALIVRSTIDLGRNLGLNVVAEGVEDEATLRQLTALGCTMAQGYLFSRPLSATAFEQWLRDCGGYAKAMRADAA